MIYRKEIDGLRAIAVVPVVLFHAGLPGFAGGYAGVDVFFVISGFLITSLILEDMERCWGSDPDPEGRFCINHELRDTLEEKWVKSQYGWAMSDDPNDLVFDYDVIDAWREAFQGEMEEQANLAEGVGRYGL